MQNLSADSNAMAFIIIALILFLAFLPMIIAVSKTGKILQAATTVLCLTSLGGTFAVIGIGGLSGMIAVPMLSAMWMAGLICGLACCLNQAADRRANDLAWGLKSPLQRFQIRRPQQLV